MKDQVIYHVYMSFSHILKNRIYNLYEHISNFEGGPVVFCKLSCHSIMTSFCDYIRTYHVLGQFQSGFRPFHGTETAQLKISREVLIAAAVGLLVLLELWTQTSHNILLDKLVASVVPLLPSLNAVSPVALSKTFYFTVLPCH